MVLNDNDIPPPSRLALAYAPAAIRPAFALLLRFDVRFAGIVGLASEPLIAQMKLAWWRDAMLAAPPQRPAGEPLLSSLFALDNSVLNDAAVMLADAWEILIANDDWSPSTIDDFAKARQQAVFRGYTQLIGAPDCPAGLGEQWALGDLRKNFGDRVSDVARKSVALPKKRIYRPLTILAMSVREVSGPRLVWHALTGR